MKEAGYVYILTNPSFKEDWVKIGKSSRPVDIRSKELDNTAVPLPFEIYATLKTVKYSEVERAVHQTIDSLTDLRIRQNREFFNITPSEALNILKRMATMLDDAEITEYRKEDKIFAKRLKMRRCNRATKSARLFGLNLYNIAGIMTVYLPIIRPWEIVGLVNQFVFLMALV